MAKVTYKYEGKLRPNMKGVEKTFDKKDLNPEKINRLISKGWIEMEVKDKPKPKPKPKAKSKKKK